MNSGERVLYLSPHLDDVVWSCPGDVMRTVASGGRADVVTVFTSSDGGDGEQTRKAEDRRAVEMLGATARHLDLVDAPWRTPWWDTDECAFGDLMCGLLDDGLVAEVVTAMLEVYNDRPLDRIVAPLGVGLHVDHRTVQVAAVKLSSATGVPVEFYEDRPYSFVDQSVEVRLAQLGVFGARVDWRAHWPEFDAARYVEAFVSGPAERQQIVEHVEAFAPSSISRTSEVIDITLTVDELTAARHAMSAYGSQIDVFMDELLLEQCATERRWRLH